jgi:hypothetical protein
VRALVDQLLEARAVVEVVAVAEEDQSVGLATVLVVDVPVAGELLERDQEVIAALGAGPGDRAQHRDEKRVDQRVVGRRVLEEQERERLRVLKP